MCNYDENVFSKHRQHTVTPFIVDITLNNINAL